jgi:CheY-like chemotaxis protein
MFSPSSARTVLIADDYRDTVESYALLADAWGWTTLAAEDGARALELAMEHQPAVLLLDIGMPGLTGWEVCQKVRAQPWGRSATIAACSGWHLPEHALRSMGAGFDVHLVKPVGADKLQMVLETHAAAAPGGGREAVLSRLRRREGGNGKFIVRGRARHLLAHRISSAPTYCRVGVVLHTVASPHGILAA